MENRKRFVSNQLNYIPAQNWANRSLITDQSVNVLRPAGTLPVKPAQLPADQLKSSEILRTGFMNYTGP